MGLIARLRAAFGRPVQCTVAKLGFENWVEWEHRNAAGELLASGRARNTVVNAGLNWLRGHMGDSGTDRAKYIGLSSAAAAPAAGDTDLGATVYTDSGLERAAGTYAAGATGTYTVTKTFTATANDKTVASAGLYYVSAGAGLFAGVAITPATLQSGDTLTITWTVTLAESA